MGAMPCAVTMPCGAGTMGPGRSAARRGRLSHASRAPHGSCEVGPRARPGSGRRVSLSAGAADIQDVPQVLDTIFYVAAGGLLVAGFGTMFGSGLLDPSQNSMLNSDGGGLGGRGPNPGGPNAPRPPSTRSLDEIFEEQEKARRNKRGKKFWE